MVNPDYAWMNGEIIAWPEAKVHVRTDAFMRGASVFEGIRAYSSGDRRELFLFRSDDHLARLFNTSMKILRLQLRWNSAELGGAIVELLRMNNFHNDIHIRPQVYFGAGEGYSADPNKIDVGCVITAVEHPSGASVFNGITVRTSSWRRIEDQGLPPRVKAAGNYLNSRYAKVEAQSSGFDDAILLSGNGKVAEGTGACVMMVRRGQVVTPPITGGILESITRDTLVELLAAEMDTAVIEREVDRTELYTADELFFCGTGHEVRPILAVDGYPVGDGQPGALCRRIQELYFSVVRGENESYMHWLEPVYDRA